MMIGFNFTRVVAGLALALTTTLSTACSGGITCEEYCEQAKTCPETSGTHAETDCAMSCANEAMISSSCTDERDDFYGCGPDACTPDCGEEAVAYGLCVLASNSS